MRKPTHYKGRMTKRQKEKEKQKFALAFILTLITVFGSYLMTQASRMPEVSAQNSTQSHTKATHEQKEQTRAQENFNTQEKLRIEATQECNKRNLGDYCIKDLMGMAWTESRFNPNTVGDNGNSYGLFQIHLGYHPNITKEQAKRIGFSVKWTLNRLVEKGYPKYRSRAIMLHNGTSNTHKTLSYLRSVNNFQNL